MKREEAIEVLENGGWWDLLIPITTIEGRVEEDKLHEALDLALSALRPVSREQELEAENKELKERIVNWRKYVAPTHEQVEKVWRGEWINTNKEVEQICKCSKCGYPISYFWSRTQFCPNCGAPMTDEAVEMVIDGRR